MNDVAIEIRGLEKGYEKFRLGPLDLTVPKGAVYGYIGPNGAGKTTTLDLVMGMGREDGGRIRVLGMDHRADAVAMKRRVGYVGPDLNPAGWGTVAKAVRFVRGFYPTWDDAYCQALARAFDLDWGDKIGTLSTGGKTKVMLLLALSHRPDVLILDEPTSGLDAVSKQQVFGELLEAVEDGERTVLISSHGLGDLERFTDHVGVLHRGRLLVEGATDEVVGRYRMVDFEGGSNGVRPMDGIRVLRRDGQRGRALVDRDGGGMQRMAAMGMRPLQETPVTLEELFVALVKDTADEEARA